MKNKFQILSLILILSISLYSCRNGNNDTQFPNTASKWKVVKIEPHTNNTKNLCTYHVHPIENLNLNANSTWLVDSIGMFNIGDTLSFYKNR